MSEEPEEPTEGPWTETFFEELTAATKATEANVLWDQKRRLRQMMEAELPPELATSLRDSRESIELAEADLAEAKANLQAHLASVPDTAIGIEAWLILRSQLEESIAQQEQVVASARAQGAAALEAAREALRPLTRVASQAARTAARQKAALSYKQLRASFQMNELSSWLTSFSGHWQGKNI